MVTVGERSHRGEVVEPSRDAARLQALLDIAKVVGAARRFEDLVELTALEAARALDAAALSIARLDREAGALRVLVNVGALGPDEERFPADETYPIGEWPELIELIEHRKSFVTTVDEAGDHADLLRRLGRDSSLSVPIVVDTRVWGELWASRLPGAARFTAADLDFAVGVATQVAAGLVQGDHLARIERLAFQDPLTGLANRRAVDERLQALLGPGAGRGPAAPVSLVLADINRLKHVNDTFGHDAGDRLIVEVAQAVSRASGLAADSLAARIGGDEFCVVVAGEPAEVGVAVAEKLCRLAGRGPHGTGVSCGVAASDGSAPAPDAPLRLFRLADAAQYRAKRSGSRRPVVAGGAREAPAGATPPDRRARRGRLVSDPMAALESGLEVLDRLGDATVQRRVEEVAEHVCGLVDGAGWAVSCAPAGSRTLVTVSSSVQRLSEDTGPDALDAMVVGATFALDDFPQTDEALRRAGSFHVEIGAFGNDPAEEAQLVASGYQAVLGAGAADVRSGWLVEVFADPISGSMAELEPVLRALLTVAVCGATADLGVAAGSDR